WFLNRNAMETILLYYDSDGVDHTIRISFDFERAFTAPDSKAIGVQPTSITVSGVDVTPKAGEPSPRLFMLSPTTMVPIVFERVAPTNQQAVIRAMLNAQGQLAYEQ